MNTHRTMGKGYNLSTRNFVLWQALRDWWLLSLRGHLMVPVAFAVIRLILGGTEETPNLSSIVMISDALHPSAAEGS